MPSITRRLEIDAGHRLMNHESKCRNAHGHRYVFEVTVSPRLGQGLDSVGRVIDFSVLKEKVAGWLDVTFDHGFMVEKGDPMVDWLVANAQKHIVLDCPPTIENIVRIVYTNAAALLASSGLVVDNVRGYETPNCYADYGISEHAARHS